MTSQDLALPKRQVNKKQLGWLRLARLAISRRWLLATLLVLVGVAINIRLGIWQLDRLEQRRAFNARVSAQLSAEPLALTPAFLATQPVEAELSAMEYRRVQVSGEYDHAHEIAIRNQYHENRLGVNLVTPLRIAGTDQYVLVNRGWAPVADYTDTSWRNYPETGVVAVQGMLRASQAQPTRARLEDPLPAPGEFNPVWGFISVERIVQQLPYPVLPVYVQQAPEMDAASLPVRSLPELEITEGPHLGYALQWFAFGALLGIGYPFFIRQREQSRATRQLGA